MRSKINLVKQRNSWLIVANLSKWQSYKTNLLFYRTKMKRPIKNYRDLILNTHKN